MGVPLLCSGNNKEDTVHGEEKMGRRVENEIRNAARLCVYVCVCGGGQNHVGLCRQLSGLQLLF